MERASRAELIGTVNSQRDQLQQYKAKLRDVVAAYKSILKEKEALEASLAVLSVSSKPPSTDNANDQGAEASVNDDDDGVVVDPLGLHKKDGGEEISMLRDQVQTLSSSLATLTQEKNKIEANFIADKKLLRQEYEQLQVKLTEEKQRTVKQAEGFELQISDLKSRIRTHQLEREKEQTDHALMLRELQTVVARERTTRDSLESKLEEAQNALKESSQKCQEAPMVSEVYERQIHQLQNELTTVRDRLKAAEVKANQPSPFVLDLQKQMSNMRAEHQQQVEKEQKKATEAEARLRLQSKQSEERVSSLEAKLSELSQVVGNYERLRFQDQQAISKLRERANQLDMENTALVKAANLTPQVTQPTDDNMEAPKIVEQIMHLRSLLKGIVEKSETDISLANIFVEDKNKADEESAQCKRYKEELEQVREEFERYKLRAQSVLKNKKDNSTSKESEILKDQIADLRDKLRMANFHQQEEVAQLQAKADGLSKALLAQEEKHRTEMNTAKTTYQAEIAEMAAESKKQRERTVALLAEKDQEIHRLRTLAGSGMEADGLHSWGDRCSGNGDSMIANHMTGPTTIGHVDLTEEQEAVNKLLELPHGAHNEAAFLHFAQERGRTEVEMSSLRKQKRQLELCLREQQMSAQQTEEKLRDEINALKEQMAEQDRHALREGANVEYLKNVLLKFLTSTDVQGKKQMMKALMTILQFSPSERDRVHQLYGKGWWGS